MTVCRKCEQEIPDDEVSPSHLGRRTSICKPCSKKRNKEKYNSSSGKEYHKNYYIENAERLRANNTAYRKGNRDKIRNYRRKYRTRLEQRIKRGQRKRLINALKSVGKRKIYSIIKYIGCTAPELKQYLENQFRDGMSWNNYGEWHIDHIRPVSSFDLTEEEDQMKCFHYTNLQPLWAKENLEKGASWDGEL